MYVVTYICIMDIRSFAGSIDAARRATWHVRSSPVLGHPDVCPLDNLEYFSHYVRCIGRIWVGSQIARFRPLQLGDELQKNSRGIDKSAG